MKIYTKTGDGGTSSLFGGTRVDKDSSRLRAYGTVDELNSQIGVVLATLNGSKHGHSGHSEESKKRDSSEKPQNDKTSGIVEKLIRIQRELFVLGWDLATPVELKIRERIFDKSKSKSEKLKVNRIRKPYIVQLEKEIDLWAKGLPEIKNFILPGGGKVGAGLQFARTIARRAEREVVALSKEEKLNINCQIYLNRLSDWLFALARLANHKEKIVETYWKGR